MGIFFFLSNKFALQWPPAKVALSCSEGANFVCSIEQPKSITRTTSSAGASGRELESISGDLTKCLAAVLCLTACYALLVHTLLIWMSSLSRVFVVHTGGNPKLQTYRARRCNRSLRRELQLQSCRQNITILPRDTHGHIRMGAPLLTRGRTVESFFEHTRSRGFVMSRWCARVPTAKLQELSYL